MKKIVIFDLDGTLLDTLCDLSCAVNFALASECLPLRSIEEVRSFVGNGIRNLIERSVPRNCGTECVERVFSSFKNYYMCNCAVKTCEYEGITELLTMLKKNNVKLGVVSNKADSATKTLIENYFPGLFDSVIGERENVRKKPEPDSVLQTIGILGGEKADTVYVGDSDVDVLTAKNAGVELVAVTWGFRAKALLASCGAKLFADSPEELFDVIEKI